MDLNAGTGAVQRKLDDVERLRARERGQEAERQLKQRKLLRLEDAPKASKPGAGCVHAPRVQLDMIG